MARIRTIKPEFWTAEQVMECSPMARLLFIGMWNFCDDGGNHPASAKTLKAEVFPADDIKAGDIQILVDELLKNGLIIEYESSGKQYWHVTGWHHQKIEKPNFKHPKPEIRQPVGEQSPTDQLPVADNSPPEGKGEEGKGIGEEGKPVAIALGLQTPNVGTTGGAVCARLKSAGVIDVNPQHPKLLALLAAGLTEDEIVAAGIEAKSRGKGFAYTLATAEGRRRDAANIQPMPSKPVGGLSKAGQSTAAAAARWLESEGEHA